MKIAVNAASAKMGGSVSYITNLLQHLSAVECQSQFLVFLPPGTAAILVGLASNIRVLPTEIGYACILRRMWWEQVTLRRFLKKENVDVLFSTGNFGMLCCSTRQILLVRNALYFSRAYCERFLPGHSRGHRLAFKLRRCLIGRSARGADVVMTPTQAMLDELQGYVHLEETMVNPYGVALSDLPKEVKGDARPDFEAGRSRLVRLLYISLYSEHKDLSTLLKALSVLNRNSGREFKLMTTANPAWPGAAWTVTCKRDLNLARQEGIREHVDFAGPLSRKETEELYRTSDIFVFPSLIESFGFPMAEAMSFGLPVLAADTPVNREVCGEAAVYFSPSSAEDLARQLLSLATDRSLCMRLGETGRQKASSRFSWSAHVRRLLEAAAFPNAAEVPGRRAVPQPR